MALCFGKLREDEKFV